MIKQSDLLKGMSITKTLQVTFPDGSTETSEIGNFGEAVKQARSDIAAGRIIGFIATVDSQFTAAIHPDYRCGKALPPSA